MSEQPAHYKCFLMFRELIKDAGPASMQEALSCLSGMANTASIRLGELGQVNSKDHLDKAWSSVYDAEKAIEP